MEYIKEYDFLFHFLFGKGNMVADARSRKLVTLVVMSTQWILVEQLKDLILEAQPSEGQYFW